MFEAEPYKPERIAAVFDESESEVAQAYVLACLERYPMSSFFTVPMDPAKATVWLRWVVFKNQEYLCAKCTRQMIFETGELHEKVHRGEGGYRTKHNCELLCGACHTGEKGEHGFARGRRVKKVLAKGKKSPHIERAS